MGTPLAREAGGQVTPSELVNLMKKGTVPSMRGSRKEMEVWFTTRTSSGGSVKEVSPCTSPSEELTEAYT